ncbi:peroxiredoxin family protein [Candidatus Colwellia aromaticivorans]|uniref:peroxiredoxin family protein n=1 Tax=Candidatus Colwellia aromaticivorans TaxID=2267621 RepID=UPI002482CCDC|nr:redoxin domain-containing protein [Candidatus Colwellia aromaticivorans]
MVGVHFETQMGQLKKTERKLAKLGFQLIGISTDNEQDLQKSIGKHQLNYQFLSDINSVTSKAFGLAYYASKKLLTYTHDTSRCAFQGS